MRNRSENQIKLVLIRHGATWANKEHRYLGKTDEALSQEGKDALLAYKAADCYPDISQLFISPMRRCVETAEMLYPNLQPVVIAEWMEMDFGAFEYKNHIDLQGDKRYQDWIDSNGTLPFPEGESREAFICRCKCGFEKMLKERSQEAETIGMIAHGGTIMALLSTYLGGEYFDYQTVNGKGYICTLQEVCDEPKQSGELKQTEHGKSKWKFTDLQKI